ncbi:endolytic transglycosylase MltG [Nodosilinea sp. P-1105]|nr:endolytic transglycosylase MltG [Nodosilinea sp. P-1105]
MTQSSKGIRWGILGVAMPVVAGLAVWQGWAWWSWASSPVVPVTETVDDTQRVQIQIPTGTSGQQIGEDLEAAGLIRSALAWRLWSRWQSFRNPDTGFQAGTYALSPGQPMVDIADAIRQGQVLQTSFTIPEGWNRQQMATYFEQQGFFSADEFLAASEQVPRQTFPWLPDDIPHLEGFLFPDTYQLPAEGVTAAAVVDTMLQRFESSALPIYQPDNRANLSLLEWVTLGSIVEKEAVVADERDLIAGVFTNRLEQNIPLGADPTVEYGLGIVQTPEQPLTWAQVGTPSPYNTYINAGLPPTPIANPGQASLQATLTPAETDYLYFVARYDGTHVFSRTLTEHEAARDAIRATFDN